MIFSADTYEDDVPERCPRVLHCGLPLQDTQVRGVMQQSDHARVQITCPWHRTCDTHRLPLLSRITAATILEGLNFFTAARVPEIDAHASKRLRRQAAALTLQGGPEKVYVYPLAKKQILEIPFSKDFDTFVSV